MFSWSSLLPVVCTIFFRSKRLLSHIIIVETMNSRERGMNTVEIIIANHPREYVTHHAKRDLMGVAKSIYPGQPAPANDCFPT